MIKQPLFGQDSSPHKTSSFLSAIITFVLWLIMTVTGAFIKIEPAVPKYKEVQIVLSSTPVATEEESSATENATAVPEDTSAVPEALEGLQIVETVVEDNFVVPEGLEGPQVDPVAVKPVETPKETPAPAKPKETPAPAKPKETPKAQTQPAKTTTTTKTTDPSKKVDFDSLTYATDYSDFDFNNTSSSTKKSSFDWSQFDDAEPENVQVSQKVDKVSNASSISGSAASASTSNQRQTSASSSSNSAANSTPAASSSTSSALSNIKSASYSASTGDSLKAITNAKTSKTSDGQISMQMKDGTTRVLLDPITPVIKLSSEAAALIESTRTVTIEFRVLASGNVPRGEIKISPESILPQKVRDEIYTQLSKWIFEASSTSAYATFEYTIEKR